MRRFTFQNGMLIYTIPRVPVSGAAMRVFNNQLTWDVMGATVALMLVALAFAVVCYAEWSSEAAFDEFLNASKPSQSGSIQPGETPISPPGQTSCYQSKGSRAALH